MLSSYWFGVLLWLAYGLLIHTQAVALTNGAAAILIAGATVLKRLEGTPGFEPVRCRRIVARIAPSRAPPNRHLEAHRSRS